MREVRLAVTGFGNVGQGIAELLRDRSREYEQYGVSLLITGVADRTGAVCSPAGLDPRTLLGVKRDGGTVAAVDGGERGLSGDAFLEGSQADVLVEAASTNFEDAEPGWSYAMSALHRGMDVILASKGALVLRYERLMKEARSAGRHILFSATIGAPLPILELADRALVGIEILGVDGVVNATANQILTVMEEGAGYEDGVRAAQKAGVTEEDPRLDVDGWDAAAKAVIIGRALFDAPLHLESVDRIGIRDITPAQLAEARANGQRYKLIARLAREGDTVRASVAPELRSLDDPLGRLQGLEMGVTFHTDLYGDMTSTVVGTGGLSTALTVLRDAINLARMRGWAR